ncbi:MAG: OFA family MFS transporter [Ruminococcaceae bacterium]|nr:OFA family MFS transporter [Oscillospiraceae bacterium]
MSKNKTLNYRWFILAVGVITMLFAGIIYAWSILKVPFASELGFTADSLALNFTLTMSFFCLGGLGSSWLSKKIGIRFSILISGVLAGVGFILTSFLKEGQTLLIFVTYALMSGLGIGMAYILIISTVNSWFPDKKGLSSGALMMGFGASSLILGNLADALFESSIGWRATYIILGIALGTVVCVSALFIKRPNADVVFPAPKKRSKAATEAFEIKDYKPTEMIKTFTFWRAFIFLVCITAVGNSVISFARDLAVSVGAEAALATTLVGVLAVCNGLGRIITGAVFDTMGRRFTMIGANILTIIAAGTTLIAVSVNSLPLCIAGLCLTGMSYGASPTVASVFTSAFYGTKHFAANLGIMNFNLMFASFVATACSSILTATEGYTVPFALLLSLAVIALGLNLSIKKP